MGEVSNDRALEAINSDPPDWKKWLANVSGMVVAAMLIGFPTAWLLDRDRSRDLAVVVEKAREDLKEFKAQVNDFHRWPRFTREHHDQIMKPVLNDISHLDARVAKLEIRMDACQRIQEQTNLRIAELPQSIPFPFTEAWQNRILQNRSALAACGCAPENAHHIERGKLKSGQR